MSANLPKPVAAFIAAAQARDSDALLATFAEDAVLAHMGRTHRGTLKTSGCLSVNWHTELATAIALRSGHMWGLSSKWTKCGAPHFAPLLLKPQDKHIVFAHNDELAEMFYIKLEG